MVLRIVAIAVLLLATTARADRARVDAAKTAYDELRFEDVLTEIAAARRAGPLAQVDEVELTRLEAYTYAIFEDSPRAIDAFRRLLALEPAFEPRGVSPKIRAYFDEARRPQAPSVIATEPTVERPPGRSIVRSRWFWAGTATVAVLAGVSIWLVARGDDARAGSLGTLTLP